MSEIKSDYITTDGSGPYFYPVSQTYVGSDRIACSAYRVPTPAADVTQHDRYTCPVCFYAGLSRPPEDHLICPSCGVQFGYDDATTTHAELRAALLGRDGNG